MFMNWTLLVMQINFALNFFFSKQQQLTILDLAVFKAINPDVSDSIMYM